MVTREDWHGDWHGDWFPEGWFPASDVTVVTYAEPVSPQPLELFCGEVATCAFRILDGEGQPRDVSALELRLVVQTSHDPPSGCFKLEGDGGGIEVGGDGNATVLVTFQEAETATIGGGRQWLLWNLTDDQVMLFGPYMIHPATKDVLA